MALSRMALAVLARWRRGGAGVAATAIGLGLLTGVLPFRGRLAIAPAMGQTIDGESASEVEAIAPLTFEGVLDETSAVLEEDGSYFNTHTFEGQAGQTVSIELSSDNFDAYLLLRSPYGELLGQDDDGGGGTNARLTIALTESGTYTAVANTYGPNETGRYVVKVQPASDEDLREAEVLAEAARLDKQAFELRRQGQYAEAIPLVQRSLNIRETALGENHPLVAQSLNNLALLYQTQGNYVAAEPLYQRSLNIRETALGENHPDVAQSLNNLAALYQTQGNYVAAEPLYQRSLNIYETALGENHPLVATSLNNLAALYELQGNYVAAEPLYQRSLNIYETALGENHPDVATSLNGLALLYQLQGNYVAAEPLYQRSLNILRDCLGRESPECGNKPQ